MSYNLDATLIVVGGAAVMALLVYVVWRYEKHYVAERARAYKELSNSIQAKQREKDEES